MGRRKKIQEESMLDQNASTETIAPEVGITITQEMTPNTPPLHACKRNGYGLLVNIPHVFDEITGRVNWRQMLKSEHLGVNQQYLESFEKKYGKASEVDLATVEDKYLVILLSGIRFLAAVRGVRKVTYDVVSISPEQAVVKCAVTLMGNYETNGFDITFEDCANANVNNTSGIYSTYLVEMAANRAYQRCIRNALNINIVSKDETSFNNKFMPQINESEEVDSTSPHAALKLCLDENNLTWDWLKQKLAAKKDEKDQPVYPDAASWSQLSDIPKAKVLSVIHNLKQALARVNGN